MSAPVHGPIKIKALCWAERTITKNPGRHDEIQSIERSRETFLLTASSPQELTAQLAAAINENPNPTLHA